MSKAQKLLDSIGYQDENSIPKDVSNEAQEAIKKFLAELPDEEKKGSNETIKAAIDGIVKAIDGES